MLSCKQCTFTCDSEKELSRHRSEQHSQPSPVSIDGKRVEFIRNIHDNTMACPLSDCEYSMVNRTPFTRHVRAHGLTAWKRPLLDGDDDLDGDDGSVPSPKKARTVVKGKYASVFKYSYTHMHHRFS